MTADPKPSSSPSFTVARRWKIALDTVLRTFLVVAVIIMANYIGSIFYRQFYLSSQTRVNLSPRTVSILQALTNRMDVTVYYDKDKALYPTIMALLNEYHRLNPHINVKTVDYERNPGEAAQIKDKYSLLSSTKDLVIFDWAGADPPKFRIAPGEALAEYGPTGMKDKKIEFAPVAFNGEKMFTSMLLSLEDSKPYNAYFLQGDYEPKLEDSAGDGYLKFGEILEENYVRVKSLSLFGGEDIPSDCNLLIIAGPQMPFSNSELTKIDHYLSQGGRLLVMFNYYTRNGQTGLEDLLAHWGVNVVADVVQDSKNAISSDGSAIAIQDFSQHPAVNALQGSSFVLIAPRPIGVLDKPNASPNSPTVTTLAQSGDDSVLVREKGLAPRSYPLMAAVEQNSVKGIANAGGNMRMVVVGDSLFLDNTFIQYGENSEFASCAVAWLLEQPTVLNGIGPQKIDEFRLSMSKTQMQKVSCLLLGAFPGAVLAFGWLVWLRRRK